MTVLACDAGGTRIKMGVVRDGRLLATEMIPADSHLGLAPALPRMRDALLALCRRASVEIASCLGLGIGFPALVNSREGRVINEYGKYRDAPGIDLRAWARETFNLPLSIDNDARVALLGEWRYGAGRGSDNLAIVTLGTGIGTAVILEGRLLRGPHFQAGNLCGHLIVTEHGNRCTCGVDGCVEAETGSASLAARARRLPGYAASPLAGQDPLAYSTVCECAARGDSVAAALLERSVNLWSALCVNMIHAFDLDRIVIGGGVVTNAGQVLEPIRSFVARHANTPWGRVEIVPAEQPDFMALLGCEVLVQQSVEGIQ